MVLAGIGLRRTGLRARKDVRWEKREKFARTMYIDADLICLMGNKGDLPGKGYGERVRPSLAAIGCRKASAREKLCVKKGKRIATLRRDYCSRAHKRHGMCERRGSWARAWSGMLCLRSEEEAIGVEYKVMYSGERRRPVFEVGGKGGVRNKASTLSP